MKNWAQVDIHDHTCPTLTTFDPFLMLEISMSRSLHLLASSMSQPHRSAVSFMGANAFRVCDLAAIKRIDFSVCRFFQPKCCVAPLFNLDPGRVVPAKLLCWVTFPVFPEKASHLMGQLTPFQRSESTGITLSGPTADQPSHTSKA